MKLETIQASRSTRPILPRDGWELCKEIMGGVAFALLMAVILIGVPLVLG